MCLNYTGGKIYHDAYSRLEIETFSQRFHEILINFLNKSLFFNQNDPSNSKIYTICPFDSSTVQQMWYGIHWTTIWLRIDNIPDERHWKRRILLRRLCERAIARRNRRHTSSSSCNEISASFLSGKNISVGRRKIYENRPLWSSWKVHEKSQLFNSI